MNKRNVYLLVLLLFPLIMQGQSSYYYDRGCYWSGTSNPYRQTNAYKEWKIGEQKGEAKCARMVIGSLLFGKGVPQNVPAAINMINKWYTKDKWICILGASLYLPKKYGFVPYDGLWRYDFLRNLSISLHSYSLCLEDFGRTANLAKALSYAKYAKTHFKNASTYDDFNKYDMFFAIEGLCYKFGLCGYNKNLIQAAKRMNCVVDANGYHDYSPMYELIKTSSSLQNLYSIMVETSHDVTNNVSHKMEWLIGLAGAEGSSKPVRDGYLNEFLFKVDTFIDDFWKLPVEDRNKLYDNSCVDIQKIYDNSLLFHTYNKCSLELTATEINEFSRMLNKYPNHQVVSKVRCSYVKFLETVMSKNKSIGTKILTQMKESGIFDTTKQVKEKAIYYDITGNIDTYTDKTSYWVRDVTKGKWYVLNNQTQYEPYGVFTKNKATSYEGKLAIVDDHEWEYANGLWNDLGQITKVSEGEDYIERNFENVGEIDLGVPLTSKTKIQIKHYPTKADGGGILWTAKINWRVFFSGDCLYFDFMKERKLIPLQINKMYEWEVGNYYVKDMTSPNNLIISAIPFDSFSNVGNNIIFGPSGAKDFCRLYYIKIFEGDELVKDFVPYYDGNHCGLWDKVEGLAHMPSHGTVTGSMNVVYPKNYSNITF